MKTLIKNKDGVISIDIDIENHVTKMMGFDAHVIDGEIRGLSADKIDATPETFDLVRSCMALFIAKFPNGACVYCSGNNEVSEMLKQLTKRIQEDL